MKLPIAYSLKNRASTLDTDAKLVNAYVETRGDPKKGGIIYAEKRPAMDSAFELPSGTGQGLFVPTSPDGSLPPQVIIDDIFTFNPTPVTKRLSFGVQPSDVALNTAISPSITVTIRDSINGVVNSSANVTLSLSSNPTGATLGGTLTRAASAGTATFNDITLNRSGEDFTLRAVSSGINSATSNTFDIATRLVFTVQPSATQTGQTLDPVEVTVQDSAANTDTAYNGDVTVAIYSGSGTLTGTLTVTAVSGVATFANLSIDTAGEYKLQATATEVSTAYPPSRAVSNSFAIGEFILTSADAGGLGILFGMRAVTSPFGSITPDSLNGHQIRELNSNLSFVITDFTLVGTLASNYFTSITIGGTTLLSAAATHTQLGGLTNWQWTATTAITTAGDIAVDIT